MIESEHLACSFVASPIVVQRKIDRSKEAGVATADEKNDLVTGNTRPTSTVATTDTQAAPPPDRKYLLERVDDAAVAQLYADGFDRLPLDQKILIWHLYQAALAGRDIYLRPALRAQPRDARRARGDPHAP